ncbi:MULTISPECIES: hypothetical protein [unclassified Halorhodospira]|uniref:hypothetical protein n=1 Tax=unclassified Halorhodospira TaxID=2626748 RepID=UPI001EE859D6|nr:MULTISPECIES: hypothetical protein [unclassified Halorhodospira]MCG5540331.1 hypothetical protein [Halorhodospira sp. M39old]MCG5545869.1 hypothetical protein [Halorhodospira sp. M38]
MNNKTKSLVLSGAAVALATPMSSALALDDVLSFGAWVNYTYNVDNDASEDRLGDIDYPAGIIYANHQHGDWFFDSELRFGSGSFQSFSGDDREWGFKELAIGRHYGEEWTMTVGKTEVPFTYSRFNFWPGERLARGFGDQYNPGIRFDFDPANNPMDMSFMFIKSQNWGTDTTSQDDGADVGAIGQHWGSNETYHKINTLVADLGFTQGNFRHGASFQAGQLANQNYEDDDDEITAAEEIETHWAAGLYTEGNIGAWDLAGQVVHYDQGDADTFESAFEEEDIDTGTGDDQLDVRTQGAGQVMMLSAGFNAGDWYHYGDLTGRSPDSDFDNLDDTYDLVLGSRYNYGPGWIYAELQLENITGEDDGITGDGDPGDRDSTQEVHLTMDYYF